MKRVIFFLSIFLPLGSIFSHQNEVLVGDLQRKFDASSFLAPAAALPVVVGSFREEAASNAQVRAWYDGIVGLPARVKSLNPNQRDFLWYYSYTHRVAGLDDRRKLQQYDPKGNIGFCFGRAMAVHLAARRIGLGEENIGKLFIFGDLRSGPNPEWRFHVTTLVQGSDGIWYTVDPIMGRPLTIPQWMRRMHEGWDPKRQARFYITRPSAVLPDVEVVPDIDKETGERIVELKFDPLKWPQEFARRQDLGERVFEIRNAQAAQRHFSDVYGGKPFNFTEVVINGERISYNGYFADLLRDLSQAPQEEFRPGRVLTRGPIQKFALEAGRTVSRELLSPRLFRLIRR